jgi:hypothetical protein
LSARMTVVLGFHRKSLKLTLLPQCELYPWFTRPPYV